MSARKQQFDAMVNAYSADLFRYAFWLCRNKEVAEDLLQETFLRAWKGMDGLQDVNAVKSWLITILRRENARRFARKQLELVEYNDAITADNISHSYTDQDAIEHALAKLDDKYREALVLQVIGGYSCEEIARMTQTNSNTVMTRLFRARQQLRKILVGSGYAERDVQVEVP